MAKIGNQIQHLQKNGETFYLGHCLENDYVFKFEMIDGTYHVHEKNLNGHVFEVSPEDDDVLDVKFDGTLISKEEYDTFGVQEYAEVELTYYPCTLIVGNPNIHIVITKNLTMDIVTKCRVYAGRKRVEDVCIPEIITDFINRPNIEELQFKSSGTDIIQLDGGHVDYSFRLNCINLDCKFGEHDVPECSLLDSDDNQTLFSHLLSLLTRWAAILSDHNNLLTSELIKEKKEMLTDIFSALVRLDVDGVRKGLDMCDIDADIEDNDEEEEYLSLYNEDNPEEMKYLEEILKNRRIYKPLISIPIAWDWLINDPAKWEGDTGFDYQRRNEEIKCLLTERCGIDWDNIPEDALPDSLARKSNDDEEGDPTYGLFDYDWETMITKNRQIDVELYVAAERKELDKVKQLIDKGADPYAKLFQDENILDLISTRIVSGEINLRDFMSGDESYCDTPLEEYQYAFGNLIHSSAYERIYDILKG